MIKHIPSKVKVFETTNYKLFRRVEGNRGINKKKIQRIIKEIESGNDILDEAPVLVKEVNSHLDILDGQHRVEIAIQMKRPVHYIIHKENMTLHNVAKVNSNVEKWKAIDFINCYAKSGDDNYIKLGKFHKSYHVSVGVCLSLFTFGCVKHDGAVAELYLQFEQGVFKIKKHKEAIQFTEICKSFSAFPGWNGRSFMIAISKILGADKCEMDVLLKKFNSDPTQLTYHSNWKGIINNLEQIYNKGNSKRRVIF